MLLGILDAEPLPQFVTALAVVPQDGPRVVELVGQRNQDRVLRGFAEVRDVALLALLPGRLGLLERVAALRDDAADLRPELPADLGEGLLSALVLGRIVQERGDRLRLAATCLDDQARHRQQMPDVGDVTALAGLVAVQVGGIGQRLVELLGQARLGRHTRHVLPLFSLPDSPSLSHRGLTS